MKSGEKCLFPNKDFRLLRHQRCYLLIPEPEGKEASGFLILFLLCLAVTTHEILYKKKTQQNNKPEMNKQKIPKKYKPPQNIKNF